MSEIVDTTDDGRHRVILVRDDYPDEPHDDFGAYVFGVDFPRYSPTVETLAEPIGDPFAEDMRAGIELALSRHGNDWDLIERYLSIVHEAVAVQSYDRRTGGRFLAVVTRGLLETWGGNVALVRESDLLVEWEAYDEGDVWGYVVQRRVTWTTDDPEFDDREEWEDTDESCGGFYGSEYAIEQAHEVLASVRV